MNRRKLVFFMALSITLVVLALLISGASILTAPLDKEHQLPAGTLLTWLGLICLPLSIFMGLKEMRNPTQPIYLWMSRLLKVNLFLSLIWLPISYLLAGNWGFNFSPKETFQGGLLVSKIFWGFSYGLVLGSLFIGFLYLVAVIFNNIKQPPKH